MHYTSLKANHTAKNSSSPKIVDYMSKREDFKVEYDNDNELLYLRWSLRIRTLKIKIHELQTHRFLQLKDQRTN